MFAVFLAASVSGAHLNPAISVAQGILGNIPGWKVVALVEEMKRFCRFPSSGSLKFSVPSSELVSPISDIMVSYSITLNVSKNKFLDDLYKLDGGDRHVTGFGNTAGLFTTYPSEHMSVWGSIFDQVGDHI